MKTLYYQDSPAGGPVFDKEPAHTIPANLEAERAVLGSLLLDSEMIFKLGDRLKSSDMYHSRHATILDAMLSLAEQREPVDYLTLTNELRKTEQIVNAGGAGYITELVMSTPSAMYVEHYIAIVLEAAARRRLIAAAGKIAEVAFDESIEIDDAINQAEQHVFGVSEGRIKREFLAVRPIITDVVKGIDLLSRTPGKLMGVPTGFGMMDHLLGGLQKDDLIILAARPGMGKTSYALSVALSAAKRYKARVGIFSLGNEQ
jgi:replicative DNA helicase